jgi:hypothetical protein
MRCESRHKEQARDAWNEGRSLGSREEGVDSSLWQIDGDEILCRV